MHLNLTLLPYETGEQQVDDVIAKRSNKKGFEVLAEMVDRLGEWIFLTSGIDYDVGGENSVSILHVICKACFGSEIPVAVRFFCKETE